eukprot:2918132-Rhodomonas_salina.3
MSGTDEAYRTTWCYLPSSLLRHVQYWHSCAMCSTDTAYHTVPLDETRSTDLLYGVVGAYDALHRQTPLQQEGALAAYPSSLP